MNGTWNTGGGSRTLGAASTNSTTIVVEVEFWCQEGIIDGVEAVETASIVRCE